MPRPSPWDLRLAARTIALAAIALCVVALIEAITDERGVAAAGTGGRALGVLPLVPIAGAVAVVIALAPTVSSGELRALAALGCSPWRARLSPIVCAGALAIAAAIGVASGRTDLAALFPSAVEAGDLEVVHGDDGVSFVSERRRIRLGPGDALERTGPPPALDAARGAGDRAKALGAALSIALAGIALAAWSGAPQRRGVIGSVLTLTGWGASQVLLFQAAGAGAVPPVATALPSAALLAVVAAQARASASLSRDERWI